MPNLKTLLKDFDRLLREKAAIERRLIDYEMKLKSCEMRILAAAAQEPKNEDCLKDQRPVISTTQAAELLGVETRTVQRMVIRYLNKETTDRKIAGTRRGKRILVFADAVDERIAAEQKTMSESINRFRNRATAPLNSNGAKC